MFVNSANALTGTKIGTKLVTKKGVYFMNPHMKVILVSHAASSVFLLSACTDQEAEKRIQLAEERAVAAEKRAVIAEEKLLMLEKKMKDDAARNEADRKATESRFKKSSGRGW